MRTKVSNFGVYVITNMITQQIYTGKGSVDKYGFCSRWYVHARCPGPTAKKKPSYIQSAIKHHGTESFKVVWLKTGLTESDAFALEEAEISLHQAEVKYNLCAGGIGGREICFSDETRARMSKSQMGHEVSLETRAKILAGHKARSVEEKASTLALLRAQKLGDKNPG